MIHVAHFIAISCYAAAAALAAAPFARPVRAPVNGVLAEQAEAIEHFSRALMNEFLHEPTVRLRAAAGNGVGLGIIDAARYLFALDNGGESAEANSTLQREAQLLEDRK